MGMMHRHKEKLVAKLAALKPKKKSAEPMEKVQEANFPGAESEKKYLKNDIMRMPKAGLIDLAEELKIEGASEKTGGELKSLILEALDL